MAVNFFDQFDEATGALDEQGNFFDQFDATVEEPPELPGPEPEPDWQTKYPDRLGPPLPASESKVAPLKTFSDEGLVSANQERIYEKLGTKNVLGVAGLAEAAARQNPTALTLITELAEGAENPWISSPGWTLINHLASGVVKETVDVVDMLTEGDVREDIIDASRIIREEAAVILGDPNIQYQGNAGTKFGFEVAEAVVNMGGALAVGYVTKNPSMALGVIGAQVGGETYQRYMTETGGNHDAAMMAAKFHVVAEVLPETIPVFAALRKTKVGEGVRRMLETTIGEGVQEMLTSILTQAYDNKQLENMSLKEAILGIDWGDVAYEGAIGTFVGATIGAPGAMGDYMEGRRQGEGPPPDSTLGQELTPDFKIRTVEENATVISDLIEVMPDLPETGDVPEEAEGFQLVGPEFEEADAEIQAWARERVKELGGPTPPTVATPEEKRAEVGEVIGNLPEKGLVVAGIGADGKTYIGGKGQLHGHLSAKYYEKIRKNADLKPGDRTWAQSGFVGADGKFLTREEALALVKSKRPGFKESENVPGELDAGDFNDQVGMGVDLEPEEPSKGVTVKEAKKKAKAQKKAAKEKKPTKAERAAIADIPTVDVVKEAIEIVGEEEFARRVEKQKVSKEKTTVGPISGVEEALGVELEARDIVAISRREKKPEPVSTPELDAVEAKLAKIPKDITDPEQFDEVTKLLRKKRDLTDQLEHGLTPKQTGLERSRLIKELHAQKKIPRPFDTITGMREKVGEEGTVPKEDEITPAEVKAATEPVEPTGKAIAAAEEFRTARPEFADTIFSFKPGDERDGEIMEHFYGEIKGTKDGDGLPLDVMLNKDYDPKADTPIFIVNQIDADTQEFYQHKVMAGFDEMAEAEEAFFNQWGEEGWGSTHELTADEFQKWRDTGDFKVEYKSKVTAKKVTPKKKKAEPTKKATKPGGKTPVGDTDLVVGNIVRTKDGDIGKIISFTYVSPKALVKILESGVLEEFANDSLTLLPDNMADRTRIYTPGVKAKKAFIPSTGKEITVKTTIVPGASLVASHDQDGAVNPDYPKELQPRDRKRGVSRIQIGQMANNLQPELLGDTGAVDSGSPIVDEYGEIESGNARYLAIMAAYKKKKVKKYLAYLRKNAASYGLTKYAINAIEDPVEVRVRQDKMSMAERAEFARAANVSGTAPMSPVETAKADAKRITDDDMKVFAPGLDGNILAHSNNTFLEKFMSHLGTLTAGGMTTADGRWNKQFGDRVQAAVFYKAYESEPLLALMAEEADPGIKNILTALSQSAPEFARARSIGDLGDLDIANDIVAAIDLVKQSQIQGASISQLMDQTDMFGDVDPDIGRIALFIEANIRSARKLDEGFSKMAQGLETTMKSQSQAGLFDEQPPVTKTDLVDAVGLGEFPGPAKETAEPEAAEADRIVGTVVLIACCKEKSGEAMPVSEMYKSPLFRAQLEYARGLNPDLILVMSAQYGVMPLDRVIEPYNVTLKERGAAGRREWAKDAYDEIVKRVNPKGSEFIFLAGKEYKDGIIKLLAKHPQAIITVPYEGLGIGAQQVDLKRRNAETIAEIAAEDKEYKELDDALKTTTIDDVLRISAQALGVYTSRDDIKLTADTGKKKIKHTAEYWLQAIDKRIKAVNEMRGCA